MIFPLLLVLSTSAATISTETTGLEPITTVPVTHTLFTTYCAQPTTFAHGSTTYTVTEPATLTLNGTIPVSSTDSVSNTAPDVTQSSHSNATNNRTAILANNADICRVGAAAGVVAAVAYFI